MTLSSLFTTGMLVFNLLAGTMKIPLALLIVVLVCARQAHNLSEPDCPVTRGEQID